MEKTSTMKQAGTSVLVALALICVVSCAKIDDESSAVAPEQPARPTVLLPTRSYEEALSLARKSIALVDRGQTRSATARSIRSERGQCVTTPSTRSGAGSDTLMYVFNFENNDGFSVIAANRAVDPVLAVAEKGNYTLFSVKMHRSKPTTGATVPRINGRRFVCGSSWRFFLRRSLRRECTRMAGIHFSSYKANVSFSPFAP